MGTKAGFILWTAVLILAAATTAVAQERRMMVKAGGPPPPEGVQLEGAEARLPLDFFHGRPVVSVHLNGKGPFPFILDTGAAGTVVDDALVDELRIAVVGKSRLGSPMGGTPIEARRLRLDRISLGGASASGVDASSMDLAAMLREPGAPRGILSAMGFPGLLLTLDFPREEVVLTRGELPEPDGETILQLDASDPLPRITIDVAGVKVPAHVDSGSPAEVALPSSYIERLPLASEPVEVGRGRTVDAEMVILGAPLAGDLRIGRHTFNAPRLDFSDGMPMANVGKGILKRLAVTLDSRMRRIRLEARPAPAAD